MFALLSIQIISEGNVDKILSCNVPFPIQRARIRPYSEIDIYKLMANFIQPQQC